MLQNSNFSPGRVTPIRPKPQHYPLRVARKIGTKCRYCNQLFHPENKRGPVPEYCSRSCQSKAYRARKLLKALKAAKEGRQ